MNSIKIRRYFSTFKSLEVNKYALLVLDKNYNYRIIFPDKKASIEIKTNESKTIQDVINDSKKTLDWDNNLGYFFTTVENEPISNISNSYFLACKDKFKINFDNGEKIYTVVNASNSYIENNNQQLVSNIADYILNHKFIYINEMNSTIMTKRSNNFSKYLSMLFKMTLLQVLTLNACTFVFFNWDIMEPITQCLTFANLIFAYYFWTFTKNESKPESVYQFYMSKNQLLKKKQYASLLDEKGLLEELSKCKI
jgi:hypothetical protein